MVMLPLDVVMKELPRSTPSANVPCPLMVTLPLVVVMDEPAILTPVPCAGCPLIVTSPFDVVMVEVKISTGPLSLIERNPPLVARFAPLVIETGPNPGVVAPTFASNTRLSGPDVDVMLCPLSKIDPW